VFYFIKNLKASMAKVLDFGRAHSGNESDMFCCTLLYVRIAVVLEDAYSVEMIDPLKTPLTQDIVEVCVSCPSAPMEF